VTVEYKVRQPFADVFQLFECDGVQPEKVVAEASSAAVIFKHKANFENNRDSHSFADIQPVKPDERPNKYSILQSDTGKWQIVKKTEKDGHWIVFVKDCGTKRLAVLMLNAIMQSAKEGTPEQRIMSASDG